MMQSPLVDPEERVEGEDPWPARMEWVSGFLVVSALCLVIGAVAYGATLGLATGFSAALHVGAATRLRIAAQQIGGTTGLLLLAAAVLLALDSITAGERRPPATPVGTASLYACGILAAVATVGDVARFADLLVGHVNAGATGTVGWGLRLPFVFDQIGTILPTLAAATLVMVLVGDGARSTPAMGPDASATAEPPAPG